MHVQGGAVEHQSAQDRIPLGLSQQEKRPGREGRDNVNRPGDHQKKGDRSKTNAASS